jgi:hypothetical protein
LARELGMTVAELLGRMSSREMSEWIAFLTLEADELEAGRGTRVPTPEDVTQKLLAWRRTRPGARRSTPLPTPEELARKLDRVFPTQEEKG